MKFLVLCLFVLLSSCTKDKKATENVLNLSLSGEVSTLDPANSYDTISASVVYQAYEQLFQYHYLKRPYSIQPLLADGLPKITNNGTRYTIKIKKGVQYHPNTAFGEQTRFVKAQDFVNQIKRLAFLPTRSNGWWLFNDRIVGINKFRKDAGNDIKKFYELNIEGLKAIDDHTLVIDLTRPYPQMLYALTMSFTSPMPLEAIKFYNNNLSSNVIGTGPFYLDTWQRRSGIQLKKFPAYREVFYPSQGDRYSHRKNLLEDAGKKIPFIDAIKFKVIKESQTRWLNFRKQAIDILAIPKDNYQTSIDENGNLTKELTDDKITLQISPTLTYWWLSFNMKDDIVGPNLKLRQAIAHAIDGSKYIKSFTSNTGQPANSIYPPGIPGYDPSHELPYEYNIEKAKKLLEDAGYPGGKGLPELNFDVRGISTVHRQRAGYVKKELAKIGIKVKTRSNTFPAFLSKSRKGNLQFWQDGWAMDYPDAENSIQLLVTKNHAPGPNATYFSNTKVDKLYKKLKTLDDGPEKFEIMREIERTVHKQLPWIMQYYARTYILQHEHIRNYRQSDIVYNYMKYIKIKK
jgi:oligopeptide transport system substrate-binding protein